MDNDNKFYWIKLKINFFNREDIDFLMSQKNGSEYVVLYQMLCLNTANSEGRLESKIGEIIVPYNAEKIARDCKYFDIDTVVVALELYKKLGLIYEEENQRVLRVADYDEIVGSESANRAAIKKREQRLKRKIKQRLGTQMGTNCLTEYRDKRLEYRDKSIDIRYNNSVSVSVSDSELKNFFERHEITDDNIKNTISDYLNNGMELEVIDNALMIPYNRNVMDFDFETEEAAIENPLEYGLAILENWYNFGVRTMDEVKKYNKLNKNRKQMLKNDLQ